MIVAVAVFAVALLLIATERVDRTKVALAGAVVMLLTQTIDQEAATAAVDWNTIGMLAGMMIMVRLTEATGVFSALAIRVAQLSRGRPFALVAGLALFTGVLSALLDNVTTVLLVVPVTFVLADALDLDPVPLVILEVIASNVGGTATLIGDPPNILIAGHTELSFLAFIGNLAPVAVVTLLAVTGGLYLVYRGRLRPRRTRSGACSSSTRGPRSRTATSCAAPCPSCCWRSSPSSSTSRCTWSRPRSRSRARR